jgi:metacaspase-1
MKSIKASVLAFATTLLWCGHASAANRALIMGVAEYPRSPLHLVTLDLKRATQFARSMNVPEANIVLLKDDQLSLRGMRNAIDAFVRAVQPGDRVFIYFSGHGRSELTETEGCRSSLVAHDETSLPVKEFQDRLKPMLSKAAKTFVLLDSCYSGGMVEVSKDGPRGGMGGLLVKSLPAKGAGAVDQCGPSNELSKDRRVLGVEEAKNTPNYYFLAASAPDQVAILGGDGSWATNAFLDCASKPKGADANGDGVITLEEASTCAQKLVDAEILMSRERDAGFRFNAMTLTVGSGAGSGAWPVAFPVDLDRGGISGGHVSVRNLLETIAQGADARQSVRIELSSPTLRIKKDYLDLKITSSVGGYLSLFMVGTDGVLYRLFPNRLDGDQQVKPNVPVSLPRSNWRLKAHGPAGTNRLLAVVAPTRDRFEGAGLPDGPFAAVQANAQSAKDIVERLIKPVDQCDPRSLGVEACSSSYAAGMIDVAEVDAP